MRFSDAKYHLAMYGAYGLVVMGNTAALCAASYIAGFCFTRGAFSAGLRIHYYSEASS